MSSQDSEQSLVFGQRGDPSQSQEDEGGEGGEGGDRKAFRARRKAFLLHVCQGMLTSLSYCSTNRVYCIYSGDDSSTRLYNACTTTSSILDFLGIISCCKLPLK